MGVAAWEIFYASNVKVCYGVKTKFSELMVKLKEKIKNHIWNDLKLLLQLLLEH